METRVIDGKLTIHLKAMHSNAAGYYVTVDGKTVYSAKRLKIVPIYGSTSSNGTHYYKFSNNGWSWPYTQLNIDQFLERMRPHIPATVSIAPQATGINNKGAFVIGRHRVGKGLELFHSHNPTLYTLESEARALAEKVALGEPGVRVVLLQVMGEVVSGGLNWT